MLLRRLVAYRRPCALYAFPRLPPPSVIFRRRFSSWEDGDSQSLEVDPDDFEIQELSRPLPLPAVGSFGKDNVTAYLSKVGLPFKEDKDGVTLEECPFCQSRQKFGITPRGRFHCFGCKILGDWEKFRDKIGEPASSKENDEEGIWVNNQASSDSDELIELVDAEKPPPITPPTPARGFTIHSIEEFLTQQGLEFREDGKGGVTVKECPFCHPIKGLPDNMFKLGITERGAFNCFRCGTHGNWGDFKKGTSGSKSNEHDTIPTIPKVTEVDEHSDSASSLIANFDFRPSGQTPFESPEPIPTPSKNSTNNQLFEKEKFSYNMSTPPIPTTIARPFPEISQSELVVSLHNSSPTLAYLTGTEPHQRWLTPEILKLYEVGATTSKHDGVVHQCVTFPQFDPSSKRSAISRHKVRSITSKAFQRTWKVGGGEAGWFGWNTMSSTDQEVVITEGEYDAMAVRQATGKAAISVPQGAKTGIPDNLLKSLDRFKVIYLWFDEDNPGQDAVEIALSALGKNRCKVVVPSKLIPDLLATPDDSGNLTMRHCKDANDALRMGIDMAELLRRAPQEKHDRLSTFADFRAAVFDQFSQAEKYKGVQSKSLKALTDITGGHRRGEVTIVTGATGSGKTTFLSQYSLDFCEHEGVRTLWGSFEIKLERLLKNMLIQYSSGAISPENFNFWADRYDKDVPMYFMNFFGATALKEVVDAMRYAVDVYQVEHVILDNLQFMSWGFAEGIDRFELQDRVTAEFRKFATERNCHISLVIHPRKEVKELGIESIFGSAKSTQEADNVIILQPSSPETMALKVLKNRFTGDLGAAHFKFNKHSLLLEECAEPEGFSSGTRTTRAKPPTRSAITKELTSDIRAR